MPSEYHDGEICYYHGAALTPISTSSIAYGQRWRAWFISTFLLWTLPVIIMSALFLDMRSGFDLDGSEEEESDKFDPKAPVLELDLDTDAEDFDGEDDDGGWL